MNVHVDCQRKGTELLTKLLFMRKWRRWSANNMRSMFGVNVWWQLWLRQKWHACACLFKFALLRAKHRTTRCGNEPERKTVTWATIDWLVVQCVLHDSQIEVWCIPLSKFKHVNDLTKCISDDVRIIAARFSVCFYIAENGKMIS